MANSNQSTEGLFNEAYTSKQSLDILAGIAVSIDKQDFTPEESNIQTPRPLESIQDGFLSPPPLTPNSFTPLPPIVPSFSINWNSNMNDIPIPARYNDSIILASKFNPKLHSKSAFRFETILNPSNNETKPSPSQNFNIDYRSSTNYNLHYTYNQVVKQHERTKNSSMPKKTSEQDGTVWVRLIESKSLHEPPKKKDKPRKEYPVTKIKMIPFPLVIHPDHSIPMPSLIPNEPLATLMKNRRKTTQPTALNVTPKANPNSTPISPPTRFRDNNLIHGSNLFTAEESTRDHVDQKFYCGFCNVFFPTLEHLNIHLAVKSHYNKTSRSDSGVGLGMH